MKASVRLNVVILGSSRPCRSPRGGVLGVQLSSQSPPLRVGALDTALIRLTPVISSAGHLRAVVVFRTCW